MGSVIFMGTVASQIGRGVVLAGGMLEPDVQVQFSAVEIFQGATGPGNTITVHTGQGGGDCGYPFVTGSQYLVYASVFQGRLTTSICTSTMPAAIVGATIDELRKLRDRGRSDDLFGNIGTAPVGHGWEDLISVHPLANIRVSVTGKSGRRFSSTTDEQGGYRFASVPAAEYSIEPDPPVGYRHGFSETVDLRGLPERVGCRIDWRAEPDGRISGRVSDTTGAAVPGFIMVERAEPDKATEAVRWRGLLGQETNDGQFSLELLAPGEYRLVFHPRDGKRINFARTFYFPTGGSGLKLSLGQHVNNVKFEIPAGVYGR